MHEHLFFDLSVYHQLELPNLPPRFPYQTDSPVDLTTHAAVRSYPFLFADNLIVDNADVVERELSNFADAGGSLVVDLTVPGLRTRVSDLPELSRRTGVHIVACTGLYIEPSWPPSLRNASESQLLEHLMNEIIDGIGDTGIRVGHIGEIGITDLSAGQQRLLRAAADASRSSGLSISVHVTPGRHAASSLEVAAALLDSGVDPGRVIMAHTEGALIGDLAVLAAGTDLFTSALERTEELLALGFNISIDTFGHYSEPEHFKRTIRVTDAQRLALVHHLVARGHVNQIVLGTDTCFKMHFQRWGGHGYQHLLTFVLPALRYMGNSEDAIAAMIRENPVRLLAVPPD